MYDVSVCVSMSRLAPAELLQGPVKTPPGTPHDLSLPAAPRETVSQCVMSSLTARPRNVIV